MTTKTKPIRASKPLPPTDGRLVCRWIERFLVHGEGDFYGQPFHLTDDQSRFIYRWYEHDPSGGYRYKRGLLGRPKGYGKTEELAAICLAEFCGPVAPVSPSIPVCAAGWEQADLAFGTAGVMLKEGPLGRFAEVFDTEILLKDRPGRMFRVAAVGATNDGLRPTFAAFDELHELVGNKERAHLVITNGLAKRKTGRWLGATTAGNDLTTLCGRLYLAGQAGSDPRMLFDWIEAPEDCDLTQLEGVVAAIRSAYGPALGVTVDLENVLSEFRQKPEYEARRYFLNQWTGAPSRWLPLGAWEACAAPKGQPEDGTEIVVGFDGSYNRDSTGLIGQTLDGYMFEIGVWERPQRAPDDWRVPRAEVDLAVHRAMKQWRVLELACDPPGWQPEIEEWAREYGESVVVMFETNKPSNMAPACSRFYSDVTERRITHDGSPVLARHLSNAVVKEARGDLKYITKDGTDSPRKIDLAVAAVVANERRAARIGSEPWVAAW